MKHGDQKQIAEKAHISTAHLSLILSGHRRPSWPVAKALAKETKTEVDVWMEGTPEQIRAAVFASGEVA